jgi:hypothetical protein
MCIKKEQASGLTSISKVAKGVYRTFPDHTLADEAVWLTALDGAKYSTSNRFSTA